MFDLDIIAGSRKYNLHSHTEFCDGRAQMEAFARKAVEMQFDVYGFSPHSPVPIQSPCNMLKSRVNDYFNEIDRIRERHGDSCRFMAAMEIDYLGEMWGPSDDYFNSLQLDYRIGSVHFVPTCDGNMIDCDGRHESFVEKMHRFFNDDIRYVVEKFYEQSIEMVRKGGFDIIGHLDKIGDNASFFKPGIEDEPWYASLVDDLINHVIANGIIVEVNTKVLTERNRIFPNQRYLQKLVDNNVPIVVNSDAHVPALINAGRDEAFSLIDSLSLRQ